MPAVILIIVQLIGGTVRTAAWTAVIASTALLTVYSLRADAADLALPAAW